ncbi:MAG: nicotinate-nucleotide adenylyltransferase [Pseudomonadota bacterium]
MLEGFPLALPGQVIGLLGGSFDPPHRGHVHITEEALRRFALDRVWWLVSPGNPLKTRPPAPLADRIGAAAALIRRPDVVITGIEQRLGTRYTAETLAALRARYPGVRFVWLMGADNLATLHHWDRWTEIFRLVPIGVLARPGQQLRAGLSPAAQRFGRQRIPAAAGPLLALRRTPAWCLQTGPMVRASSTDLRRQGAWPGGPSTPGPPR